MNCIITRLSLILCLTLPLHAQQVFVDTDLTNFYRAYDSIRTTNDTLQQQAYLRQLYLDPATPGLTALREARNYTAEQYLAAINDYPQFWETLRPKLEGVATHYPGIERNIDRLRELYPALRPAPVFFSVGVFRTNGTAYGGGVLMGSEMCLADKSVDVSELPDNRRGFYEQYTPVEDLLFLTTHEFVHTQQRELVHNLLTYCIYEGIAEFVAVLASGKEPFSPSVAFARDNYVLVRDKFEEDLYIGRRTYDWLWSDQTTLGQRDLGYGVGYAIAQRYYDLSADKQQAIKTMIELDFTDEAAVTAYLDTTHYLTRPIQELYDNFEASRPTITHLSGIENGSKTVAPDTLKLSLHFSEPLDGHHTSIDFGPDGEELFPPYAAPQQWSQDRQAYLLTFKLEPNHHYQFTVMDNFRNDAGIPLKPYAVEFWTTN